MASIVQICNFGLGQIGQDTINALTEESPSARACSLYYEQARDAVLSEIWWGFATGQQTLALTSTNPNEWDYAYTLPSDCLFPRYIPPVVRNGTKIPFEWAGDEIWTDQDTAVLIYTKRVSDPALFHPLFVDALALKIATLVCMPLSVERSLRSDVVQLYRGAIAAARQADTNASDRYDYSNSNAQSIEARA